jgi:hypothetical protein
MFYTSNNDDPTATYGSSTILVAYVITAVLEIGVSLMFLILYCNKRSKTVQGMQNTEEEDFKKAILKEQTMLRIAIIIMNFLMMALYTTCECVMGEFFICLLRQIP